jgi:hypothetical protein
VWVLALSGEADLATHAVLEGGLAEAAQMKREKLILDVTRLRFCDVGCAELILTTAQTTPLALAGATGIVRRVFEFLDPVERVPRYRGIRGATLQR